MSMNAKQCAGSGRKKRGANSTYTPTQALVCPQRECTEAAPRCYGAQHRALPLCLKLPVSCGAEAEATLCHVFYLFSLFAFTYLFGFLPIQVVEFSVSKIRTEIWNPTIVDVRFPFVQTRLSHVPKLPTEFKVFQHSFFLPS